MYSKRISICFAIIAAAASAAVRFDDDGALRIEGDKYAMNWILKTDGSQYSAVTEEDAWGSLSSANSAEHCGICARRMTWEEGEDMGESLTLSNKTDKAVSLKGVAVNFPFNDNYTTSSECVKRRCNAHLWPFGSAAWVCCIRMGGEGPHLGWMLTKGELDGYTISKRGNETGRSNFRGVIAFCLPDKILAPGESYTLEWRLFAHNGWDDFFAQLEKRDSFAPTREHYVVEDAANLGEWIERVEKDGKWTRVETLAISDFKGFIERRLDFILDHQQYDKPGDIRDGAFLPYDNETDAQYKNWEQTNHRWDMDEGRERIGMGIAIAEAVRDHGYANSKALTALRKYARFIRTALQNGNFKTKSEVLRWKHNRIYNYAWVVRFYFDMFDVTGEAQYLDWAVGTAKATFREGGHKFYLIDMPVRQSIETLRRVGRNADADELLGHYREVAENYLKKGLLVPKSEVNYEQSIIAPAANFLCEMYLLTKEEKYKTGVESMLPAVEAFNGHQPSWHLNDVAIRHWDGFWFGKRQLYGDTFPHYWSCISADLFGNWAEATGDESFRRRASEICKANLGLFTESGRGGAAYMYPNLLNGNPGRYLEPMANDQDFAIVYASRWLKEWGRSGALPGEIPQRVMEEIYEEVRTPVKHGVVLRADREDWMVDCPVVFRVEGKDKWFMTYVQYNGSGMKDGRGYQTFLAESDDLLDWKKLGCILPWPEDKVAWDFNQRAGYPALLDMAWGGEYTLGKVDGKYWLSYFGSDATGYEQGKLGIGLAATDDPSAAKPWCVLPKPVLTPDDQGAAWWEKTTIYKNQVFANDAGVLPGKYLMYYNAKGINPDSGIEAERIGIAYSDDMTHWTRWAGSPVISNEQKGKVAISGDAIIQKIRGHYVMFYFGVRWPGRQGTFNTFAVSRDMAHWTEWRGAPLVAPSGDSAACDAKYAHKSAVVKWRDNVYHFYCAVDAQGRRTIALATRE